LIPIGDRVEKRKEEKSEKEGNFHAKLEVKGCVRVNRKREREREQAGRGNFTPKFRVHGWEKVEKEQEKAGCGILHLNILWIQEWRERSSENCYGEFYPKMIWAWIKKSGVRARESGLGNSTPKYIMNQRVKRESKWKLLWGILPKNDLGMDEKERRKRKRVGEFYPKIFLE